MNKNGTCTIDGCEKVEKARGWCHKHWRLWRVYGDPHRQRRTVEDRLSEHGTMTAYTAHIKLKVPICEPCRNARRAYMGVKRPKLRELATYESIHAELRTRRGPASNYTCPCGKQAREWAHVPNERQVIDAKHGLRYSRDIRDYTPLCKRCHSRMDASLITECPQGHAYDEANTYICKQGKRQCRACIRERNRRRRAKAAENRIYDWKRKAA